MWPYMQNEALSASSAMHHSVGSGGTNQKSCMHNSYNCITLVKTEMRQTKLSCLGYMDMWTLKSYLLPMVYIAYNVIYCLYYMSIIYDAICCNK